MDKCGHPTGKLSKLILTTEKILVITSERTAAKVMIKQKSG